MHQRKAISCSVQRAGVTCLTCFIANGCLQRHGFTDTNTPYIYTHTKKTITFNWGEDNHPTNSWMFWIVIHVISLALAYLMIAFHWSSSSEWHGGDTPHVIPCLQGPRDAIDVTAHAHLQGPCYWLTETTTAHVSSSKCVITSNQRNAVLERSRKLHPRSNDKTRKSLWYKTAVVERNAVQHPGTKINIETKHQKRELNLDEYNTLEGTLKNK